jgi:hypothetical protein
MKKKMKEGKDRIGLHFEGGFEDYIPLLGGVSRIYTDAR